MNHRIRAAALIVEGDRILLVEHTHPDTGETWWVPPGGGLEDRDASVFDCARREVTEETGLTVVLDRIVYIREFRDTENDAFNLELFINTKSHTGNITLENVRGNGPDEYYIRDVRWFSKDELAGLTVYPAALLSTFWRDLELGFPQTFYLGSTS